jgi:predicted transposase YdaD
VLQAAASDKCSQEELNAMGKSMAEIWIEESYDRGRTEGRQKGREEGREQGREEGRLDAVREMILRIGRRRLGEPSVEQRGHLDRIADLRALETLSDALMDATDWNDLLNRA